MGKIKLTKTKKYFIYVILLTLIISFIVILYFYFHGNNSNLNIKENIFYPYKYFQNISIKDILFKNREIIIIDECNSLMIGRNKKELENGYYDIKIDINENSMNLLINNLQKDDIEFKSISDEYLDELEIFLSILLNNENISSIIDIVKKDYINLRNDDIYIENRTGYNQINIDEYIIVFSIENNMLRIDIKN